ncbi:MAG: hypothetical protein IPL35_13980 [Sphingobacteriales bacterium]|nr:hypothetical protein [Sphingobacteriales bacterium]
MKYASGQAIAMLPWFFVAHYWASHSQHYPADGFSFPYQICIGVGMFVYAILGLWVLRKVLLRYFDDRSVAILLLILVIGTNYLNYSSIDQAMTHNTLFLIYALLLYVCNIFYQNPTFYFASLLGLLCGLAALIRPTEIISVLIPLLFGIVYFRQFGERLKFIQQHYLKVIVFSVSVMVVVGIQILYWKTITGEYLVYSYQKEGFSWLHPHIQDYLLSYRCGWWRFCPMMILPFAGLLLFYRRRIHTYMIYMFILLAFYIVTAWDVWDYGGTAGRAMVQYYPLLLFPLGALVEWIRKQKIGLKCSGFR